MYLNTETIRSPFESTSQEIAFIAQKYFEKQNLDEEDENTHHLNRSWANSHQKTTSLTSWIQSAQKRPFLQLVRRSIRTLHVFPHQRKKRIRRSEDELNFSTNAGQQPYTRPLVPWFDQYNTIANKKSRPRKTKPCKRIKSITLKEAFSEEEEK